MEIAQEKKAALLERAVINSSIEELSKLYDELGYVEMSAPALGLACRFRGLAMVKALVEKGAVFDFPSTEEIEIKYHCHIGEKHASYRENYRTNYSLYLLRSFRGGIKGACCLKGMKFVKNAKREDGKQLPFLADEERVEVLNYLIEKREKLFFQPEEMLFYAIFAKDAVIFEELKKRGVVLSEKRIYALTEGVMADGYWFEFGAMTRNLAEKDYIRVMQQLYLEMREKPFRYTEKMFDITQNRFHDIDVFAFFLAHFSQKKMKKYQIIRDLIDENALDALSVVEREGWLAAPRKRDEMIAYATQVKNTEALAWLLDFKNRTADLDAEQEKAEKKMMRELSAAPDSVTALRGIWNYKKREDGTLIINSYKGTRVEVIVPERIGKSVVTAIGKGAFAGDDYKPGANARQIQQHKKITKIVLPETIQYIGKGAFHELSGLQEMNIPDGVKEIDTEAFRGCCSLKGLKISETVEKIEEGAFYGCRKLEEVHICEGMREIRDFAFYGCASLKELTIPKNVVKIGRGAFSGCSSLKELMIPGTVKEIGEEAFAGCRKLKEMCIISEGVREIAKSAFYACQNVKKITIPKTVEKIGKEAFADCRNMEEVYISEGVREIGEHAFIGCGSLTNVTIPGTVEKVGAFAFDGCKKLEKVHICEGIQEIGENAFGGCISLKTLTIPSTVKVIKKDGFMHCKMLESVRICEGVEEIEEGAFAKCQNLKEVYMPKSVQRIRSKDQGQYEYDVFEECPNLTVICPEGSRAEAYCKGKNIRNRFV